MPRKLILLAFVSGSFLFAVLVYVSGYLAAITIPKSYFEYFGRQNAALALTLEEAFVVALPLFLLTVGWAYPSLRPMRAYRWKAMAWCLAGLLVAQAAFDVYIVKQFIEAPMPEGATKYPVGTFALNVIFPRNQSWAYLNVLVAPAGIVVAAFLIGGGQRGSTRDRLRPRHAS